MTLKTSSYSLNTKQIKDFQNQLKNNHKCWLLIFNLCLITGGRISEILSLNINNLSIDRNISIITFTNTKNKQIRQAYIPLRLALKLKNHTCKSNSFLFFPHNRLSVNHLFIEISKKLNILRVTPHTLRRTFALILINKNYPLNHLQTLLGHQNLKTTNSYTKVLSPINPLKFLM